MIWFPQLTSGSVVQFPVTRWRRWRMIANTLEDGGRVTLPDVGANAIGWRVEYRDLSDPEVQNLNNLFRACQGSAALFTFVDPLANLLGWSEDLTRPDWQASLLSATVGATDPFGTHRAWTLTNGTTGPLGFQQTIHLSGDYMACFSIWVRSAVAVSLQLHRDAIGSTVPAATQWTRVALSQKGIAGAASSTFALVLNPGQQIDIFGPQVEAQPSASPYKQSGNARGIYPKTSFASDTLNIVSTSVGLSSCELVLRSQL